ncbi:hypothetical protein DL766_004767 [Monosporascus sp. MC13-8B]|uniref:Uncharacterized protein n=1 Tax=Monosporascus cannonballus TaxID=155416 RepID=A0ABY0HHM9_9PEZI|nr:hypothetical protein DL762_000900 [Monosporascus cannonballus]RYO96691.1 hypothetical protein DL763_003067 [Monosporascus cannonballus]RYP30671.1 hypothetical protein DL766_004767 [Monosporascus sp. MC13-8B]
MNSGAHSSSKSSSPRYNTVIVDNRSSYYMSTSSTASMSSSRGSTLSSSSRTGSTTDSSRGSSPAMKGEYRDRNANGHKASYSHWEEVTVLQPYGARGYDPSAPTASYHVPKDRSHHSSR